jgi:hypothetical protein
MVSEATWGFSVEDIQEAGFNPPPVGHYTLEIADTPFKVNGKGERYLWMVYNIVDAEDAEWVGKKYYQYVSLDPERFQYTKSDFRRMGVPPIALTNDGGPENMVGTVFECDFIENKGFINMRQIKPLTKVSEAQPAEAAKAAVGTPAPARAKAAPSGRR